MSKIITTNNGQQYRTQNFLPTAAAAGAGVMTYFTVKDGLPSKLHKLCGNKIAQHAQQVEPAAVRDCLQKVLDTPEVAKLKLKIIDMDELPKRDNPSRSFYDLFTTQTKAAPKKEIKYSKEILELDKLANKLISNSTPLPFRISDTLRNAYENLFRYSLQEGKTACCFPTARVALANIDKIGLAVSHEIGHALNPKLNVAAVYTKWTLPLFLGTALLKRKKLDGEQCKNKFDKATDFIKNNAPIFATATQLPLLGVEILASHKAQKLAKPHLSKEAFKHMKKLHAAGIMTYVMATVATGAGVYLASKVRDLLSPPKIIKKPVTTSQKTKA